MSDTRIIQICAAAGPPKALARLVGASASSARRWQAGTAAMPAAALLHAARRSTDVREALLTALGLDDAACLARLDAIEAAIAVLKTKREARHALATVDARGGDRPQPHLVPGASGRRRG